MQTPLPDSISPCMNVRRSCGDVMKDISYEEGGKRSVIIDETAIKLLAEKVTGSILEKIQNDEVENNSNTRNDNATPNSNSAAAVDECIDNLNFASWDEENWHYCASKFNRPQMSIKYLAKQKFERVALYIMVMDCINFCFWPVTDCEVNPTSSSSSPKKNLLEYEHLAGALRELASLDDKGSDDDAPVDESENGVSQFDETTIICAEDSYILAPQNLIKLTEDSFLKMLLPLLPSTPGIQGEDTYIIPNAKERVRLIIEMAQALLTFHDGSATAFIAKAGRSGDKLVHLILQYLPGFRDATVDAQGRWVAFYKRAQILVADLWAALGDRDVDSGKCRFDINLCNFLDTSKITTFADYRVPQLLRNLGVLRYSPSLSKVVDNGEEIDAFSPDELYIRASTVQAVDRLVDLVSKNVDEKTDTDINAIKMDWYLWNIGEKLDREGSLEKHHRVRTIFY